MYSSVYVILCRFLSRREKKSGERKFNVEVKRQSHDRHVHLFLSTALLCCNHEPTFSSFFFLFLLFCAKFLSLCKWKWKEWEGHSWGCKMMKTINLIFWTWHIHSVRCMSLWLSNNNCICMHFLFLWKKVAQTFRILGPINLILLLILIKGFY